MPAPTIDDPYAVLGVPNDATEADVKKAYRKLALKYHPDRQNGKSEEEVAEASAMFVKIAEAQDILTDPVKKYDFRMKQEAKQNKSNAASAAAAAAANRGKGGPQSVRRPNTVRKKSPVPPNRQASTQSMRRGQSPRAAMNRKQASVRVPTRPPGVGRSKSDQPPRRVNSVGALPTNRSGHAPRSNRPIPQNATFNVNKPPPTASNRSKTAQMLRTPSSASVASKRPKKKPVEKTGDQEGSTFTFVRNNGKTPLKKTASGNNGKTPLKRTPSGKNGKTAPKKTLSSGKEDTKPKKKKKKKKKAVEGEQTFTFVRNSTSTKPAGKVKKPKNDDSASVMKKKKTKLASKPSSMRGGMLSPQQAPRKSILGLRRASIQATPQSTKSKKKSVGIKGFLGRAPLEKD